MRGFIISAVILYILYKVGRWRWKKLTVEELYEKVDDREKMYEDLKDIDVEADHERAKVIKEAKDGIDY